MAIKNQILSEQLYSKKQIMFYHKLQYNFQSNFHESKSSSFMLL